MSTPVNLPGVNQGTFDIILKAEWFGDIKSISNILPVKEVKEVKKKPFKIKD